METEIKRLLEFGDVTRIAKDAGVTTATVQRAIRGEGAEATVQQIQALARLIIQQRAERKALLAKQIKEQRKP